MKKSLIIANWKMNLSPSDELARIRALAALLRRKGTISSDLVICPSFLGLYPIAQFLTKQRSFATLGAQDCFWEESGAYTGDVSPLFLHSLGVQYVLVGHSERKKRGETLAQCNKKIKAAIKEKLTPVVCIGESSKDRLQGHTEAVLAQQLTALLSGLTSTSSIIIAYEPLWAIGSGSPINTVECKKVTTSIRSIIKKITPRHTPILYGGSVSHENAELLVTRGGINGLLVGSASLDPVDFAKILQSL